MKILKQLSINEWSIVLNYMVNDFDGRPDSPLKADWNQHIGYYNIHYCIANDNRLEDI